MKLPGKCFADVSEKENTGLNERSQKVNVQTKQTY